MHVLGILLTLLCSFHAPTETPRTMRVDYYHTGNSTQEMFSVDQVVVEPLPWPGNPHRPCESLDLGKYAFEVLDEATGKKLYERGFDSVYGEWVTTAEARQVNRTFHESLRFPAPTDKVKINLRKRDANNAWQPVWSTTVDPKNQFVNSSSPEPQEVLELHKSGDPALKVDLLLLGDGYTSTQKDKFKADAQRLLDAFFATSPFKERRKDFNVWGISPTAREPGISRPSEGIHKASPIGTTYDAFGSERYVLTFENKQMRQVASAAPYDFVAILVNSPTYGGGGIYGQYCTVTADSLWAPYVFVHELGHHVAALADEYYTSPVAYLPATKRIEPWEPNVTAFLDPDKLKWKDLLSKDTPLPTPWEKAAYESMSRDFQQRREKVRKERRSESEFDALVRENKDLELKHLGAERYAGKVGVFEGASYEAKGLYRSEVNCIMFTRTDFFCAVCKRALTKVMDAYAVGP